MRPGNRSRPPAFTLVELLVIVAIIALLISLLLPSLESARQQAQGVACASNERSILLALFMYRDDFDGYIPPNLWSEDAWGVRKEDVWFYKLFPTYMQEPDVLACPGDPMRGQFDFDAESAAGIPHRNAKVPTCGYGMNYLLRHFREPVSFDIDHYPPTKPFHTILFAEVGPDAGLEEDTNYGTGRGVPWRDTGRIVWDDGARAWYSGPSWLTARHAGGINIAAMDGAVHRVRTLETMTMRAGDFLMQYPKGISGDCYFCNYHPSGADKRHYSFAHANLYWWTGPVPDYRE